MSIFILKKSHTRCFKCFLQCRRTTQTHFSADTHRSVLHGGTIRRQFPPRHRRPFEQRRKNVTGVWKCVCVWGWTLEEEDYSGGKELNKHWNTHMCNCINVQECVCVCVCNKATDILRVTDQWLNQLISLQTRCLVSAHMRPSGTGCALRAQMK